MKTCDLLTSSTLKLSGQENLCSLYPSYVLTIKTALSFLTSSPLRIRSFPFLKHYECHGSIKTKNKRSYIFASYDSSRVITGLDSFRNACYRDLDDLLVDRISNLTGTNSCHGHSRARNSERPCVVLRGAPITIKSLPLLGAEPSQAASSPT